MSAPGKLGLADGTALFVGAVLGPGVLALPALAVAAAGPASVVAWAGLLVLSAPVAWTFATLGARYSDGGGLAAFVGHAFGPRAAVVVGWWFYFAVPLGVLAGALIGADYVTAALGAGGGAGLVLACVLLVAAFLANHIGLRVAGRVQLLLVGLLVVLLVVAVLTAGAHFETGRFTPFLPHGWVGVAEAGSVLFFAFAGWEAVSSLSAEFSDPRRQLPRVTAWTFVIVGLLYAALAVTTVGVLGPEAANTAVPLTLLLERGIGAAAPEVSAVAAVLLSFGAINAYLAGGARLGAALARDGGLPTRLASERRSLALLAVVTALLVAVVVVAGVELDLLMRATSACLAAVTFAGTAAAVRLLRAGGRRIAIVATAFTGAVLLACGPFLLLPLALGLAACARRTAPTGALR
ncbi:APC family permease [Saccharopolyspora taberi]|uniref:Amino acid permease n=1 Tax=Saccharopolyspora taberi TaxID=60895 RepID=A0ABN3VDU3_9PSEU